MSEFTINGHEYQTGRLDVYEQAKVLKRVARLFQGVLKVLVAGGADDEELQLVAIQDLTNAFGEMPDADIDWVLKTCMGKTMTRPAANGDGGGQWRRLMVNGQIMFEDRVDLEVATKIAMETVQENLGPTLRGLLGPGSAEGEQPTTSSP